MPQYHEPLEILDEETRDISRAISSLKEELEAINWYNQRVNATKDPELKAVMAHNRDEEIEHACMALEWLRRNMDKWDQELRTYLFGDSSIIEVEKIQITDEINASSGIEIGDLKDHFQEGPFVLIVGEEVFKRLNTSGQVYPLFNQIESLINGKILLNPVIKGAFLFPYDNKNFELTIGQDFSIGYDSHNAETIKLFITESLTFRVLDENIIVSYTI